MKEQKKQLRKQIKEEKKGHTNSQLKEKSSEILKLVEQHPHFIASKTILCYHSLSDEVQTHEFVDKWHNEKKILLPVVKGDMLELRPYTGASCLKSGSFNIEEPEGKVFTQFHEIDFSIIPGIAFDRKGNRLGRGKGYYDKLLPFLQSYNIGICFGFQAKEEIPSEDFDHKMDEVWTENGRWE